MIAVDGVYPPVIFSKSRRIVIVFEEGHLPPKASGEHYEMEEIQPAIDQGHARLIDRRTVGAVLAIADQLE